MLSPIKSQLMGISVISRKLKNINTNERFNFKDWILSGLDSESLIYQKQMDRET